MIKPLCDVVAHTENGPEFIKGSNTTRHTPGPKETALEKAYREHGGGSPRHIEALRAYEKRVYGCYVSELASKGV